MGETLSHLAYKLHALPEEGVGGWGGEGVQASYRSFNHTWWEFRQENRGGV